MSVCALSANPNWFDQALFKIGRFFDHPALQPFFTFIDGRTDGQCYAAKVFSVNSSIFILSLLFIVVVKLIFTVKASYKGQPTPFFAIISIQLSNILHKFVVIFNHYINYALYFKIENKSMRWALMIVTMFCIEFFCIFSQSKIASLLLVHGFLMCFSLFLAWTIHEVDNIKRLSPRERVLQVGDDDLNNEMIFAVASLFLLITTTIYHVNNNYKLPGLCPIEDRSSAVCVIIDERKYVSFSEDPKLLIKYNKEAAKNFNMQAGANANRVQTKYIPVQLKRLPIVPGVQGNMLGYAEFALQQIINSIPIIGDVVDIKWTRPADYQKEILKSPQYLLSIALISVIVNIVIIGSLLKIIKIQTDVFQDKDKRDLVRELSKEVCTSERLKEIFDKFKADVEIERAQALKFFSNVRDGHYEDIKAMNPDFIVLIVDFYKEYIDPKVYVQTHIKEIIKELSWWERFKSLF